MVATIVLSLVVGVLLSPFALTLFRGDISEWERLSSIGETYGAAAAVLSAIALLGVGISVFLQARQARHSRILAQREQHAGLIMAALDDPVLLECWGHPAASAVEARRITYVNLIISSWETSWLLGQMTEVAVTAAAMSLFSRTPGRSYWEKHGEARRAVSDRRLRRFIRLVDDAYVEAVKLPARLAWETPAEQDEVMVSPRTEPSSRRSRPHSVSFAGGLLLGYVLSRKVGERQPHRA
ncbi:DUF6082 family protein [Luedemannella helvata]|uniref:DUF6082 family protein n=1 Tax=Luedemannella helvata TaxID=349315 RepID=UPI0031DEB47B